METENNFPSPTPSKKRMKSENCGEKVVKAKTRFLLFLRQFQSLPATCTQSFFVDQSKL